jgi:membrane protein implicated in regulation of membrane protease activity
MTWQNFYLFCFLVGFLWSLLSLVVGHLHIDLPFHHGDAGGLLHHDGMHHGGSLSHGGDFHHGGDHGGHPPHHLDHVQEASGFEQVHAASVSPLNLGTIAAFMAWFGGAGYLLTAYSPLWFIWSFLLSLLTGFAGASVVFWFLAKVLVGRERNLDPADYRMTGVLGHISSPIRASGTGEIIYSQEGTRRTCGARSEDGKAIAKGTEVLVTRYESGIAYVRPWDEFSKSE